MPRIDVDALQRDPEFQALPEHEKEQLLKIAEAASTEPELIPEIPPALTEPQKRSGPTFLGEMAAATGGQLAADALKVAVSRGLLPAIPGIGPAAAIGIPALATGVYRAAYAEPGSRMSEFLQGAATGAISQLLPSAAGRLWRWKRAQPLEDMAVVSQTISRHLPELKLKVPKGPIMGRLSQPSTSLPSPGAAKKTWGELAYWFGTPRARKFYGELLGKTEERIIKRHGDHVVTGEYLFQFQPYLQLATRKGQPLPFTTLGEMIKAYRRMGFAGFKMREGTLRDSLQAAEVKRLRDELKNEILGVLSKLSKDDAEALLTAQERYAKAITLSKLFQANKAFARSTKPTLEDLQLAFREPTVQIRLGYDPNLLGDVERMLFRGGPPIGSDVAAELGLRLWSHGVARGLGTSLHPSLANIVGQPIFSLVSPWSAGQLGLLAALTGALSPGQPAEEVPVEIPPALQ